MNKKIIDGKMYNINTADLLCSYWNGLGSNDFRNISETLYRTKKGAWFILGSGGPMTKYAEPCGNMTSGSEDIFVISEQEAKKFVEKHGSTELYQELFEVEEA